ncbi:hypothetical protein [Azonexus sp.]|uniref:hypothetical protein n=1 Tax=Azonexus sp. TaxID=1872668 RepID=UPI0039E2930F
MFSKITALALKPHTALATQQHPSKLRAEAEEPPKNSLQALRKKQLENMQNSLSALQEMKKQLSPKKQAAARAGYLKQRLEMLRDMLAKLPPGNHKALAQELKQIAKELAALGKELGGQGASSTPALTFHTDAANGDTAAGAQNTTEDKAENKAEGKADTGALTAASAPAEGAETASGSAEAERLAGEATASAATDEKTEGEQNSALADARNDPSGNKINSPAANSDAQDEKALRTLLKDANKLLKHVADLLKAKTLQHDKESKKIYEDIEHALRKLDDSLRSGDNPLYSALGELSTADENTGGTEASSSGSNISVSA